VRTFSRFSDFQRRASRDGCRVLRISAPHITLASSTAVERMSSPIRVVTDQESAMEPLLATATADMPAYAWAAVAATPSTRGRVARKGKRSRGRHPQRTRRRALHACVGFSVLPSTGTPYLPVQPLAATVRVECACEACFHAMVNHRCRPRSTLLTVAACAAAPHLARRCGGRSGRGHGAGALCAAPCRGERGRRVGGIHVMTPTASRAAPHPSRTCRQMQTGRVGQDAHRDRAN
jgi:hypothetical protein